MDFFSPKNVGIFFNFMPWGNGGFSLVCKSCHCWGWIVNNGYYWYVRELLERISFFIVKGCVWGLGYVAGGRVICDEIRKTKYVADSSLRQNESFPSVLNGSATLISNTIL